MKVRALGLVLTGVGLAALLTSAGCKTGTGQESAVLDARNPQPTVDQETMRNIEKLDRGCGSESCHGGSGGKVPYNELKKFALMTKNYYVELKNKKCFAAGLSAAKSKICLDIIVASGGLNLDGGIFQAAIRKGVVHKIAVAAGNSGFLDGLETKLMPPDTEPSAADDVANDDTSFLKLAEWLSAQPDNNFAALKAARGGEDDQGGIALQCDAIPDVVKNTYRPDFQLSGVNMFGCPSAWPDDPTLCLKDLQSADFANKDFRGHEIKILRRLEGDGRGESSYWMRSSADGRFASIGNGRIEDFKIKNRSIRVLGRKIDPFVTIQLRAARMLGPIARRRDQLLAACADAPPDRAQHSRLD